MKSWRERVLDGSFATEEGRQLWCGTRTCPVGEAQSRFGLGYGLWMALNSTGHGRGHSDNFYRAILGRDATAAERVLDELEDAALEMKRALGDGP